MCLSRRLIILLSLWSNMMCLWCLWNVIKKFSRGMVRRLSVFSFFLF